MLERKVFRASITATLSKTLIKSKHVFSLGKPNLSLFVSSSAVTGFLLSSNDLDCSLFSIFTGTLLCSFSANAFNQLYEIKTDKLMNRTKNRPLPSKKLSFQEGLTYATFNAIAGPLILSTCGPTTTILGVMNIFLYSAVYTPLKQKTVLNTWIGSVVGAIPPLMGYCANSDLSSLLTINALYLPALLYFWQLPHFFALSYLHKADYNRGHHQMLSDDKFDPDGLKTAHEITKNSLFLSTIPFLCYFSGAYSVMLPLEGLVMNGYFLYLTQKFRNKRSKKNARKIFLASLWYLPLMMSFMVVHKKGDNGDLEIVKKIRKLGKDICFHEYFVSPSKTAEEKPFCQTKKI